MFFLDGKLYKKLAVVASDNSVVAFCYQDENTVWLNRTEVRKKYRKAYSITRAAGLMSTSSDKIKAVYNTGLMKNRPEFSYHIDTGRKYQKIKSYISQDDMLELRQVIWDQLPKNQFGIPHNDTMPNEAELKHRMDLGDDREFVVVDDGVIKIFRDEYEV